MDRRLAWLVLAGTAAVLAGLAWWLVPWSWVPGGHLVPVRASDLLSPAEGARAEAYANGTRRLAWLSTALALLVACLLGLTPLGSSLVRRATRRLRWWLAVPAATLLLVVLGDLVTVLPDLLVRDRRLRFGLTTQGVGGWLSDRGVALLLTWVTGTLLALLVVAAVRRWPRRWFVPVGITVAGLTFVLSFLYPVVVEPLTNRFTPMPDSPLRTRILALAAREDVPVRDVLVADASRRTTTLNAYVSGFGSTRRVVVYDNLLRDASPRQVESVVAHELGHAGHDDVLLGTGLAAVAGLGGVALLALLLDGRRLRRAAGVAGPADAAVVPLVLALVAVGTLLAAPAQNAVSRAIEARADRSALEATRDPTAFVQVQRQLAVHSLADPTPVAWSQWWFGTHPTFLQRAGLPAALQAAGDDVGAGR